MAKRPFTTKQQRFIDFYDGNATDAARKAGYKQAERSGLENVGKRGIWAAIQKREKKRNGKYIKTRKERQEFWSKKMDDAGKDSDQLKASELLGRSEADFTDTQKHVGADGKDLRWLVEVVKAKEG